MKMATDYLTAIIASSRVFVVITEVQKKRRKRKMWTKPWIL